MNQYKKTIEIEPVHVDSCFSDQIATVLEWRNQRYELMFLQGWNFVFCSDIVTETIGEQIDRGYGYYTKNLHDLHGIKIDTYYVDEAIEFYDQVVFQIKENNPVCIYMDAYWCPWYKYYKQQHYRHYCLVVGFDLNKKVLFCMDPNFANRIWELDIAHIKKTCYEYRVIVEEKFEGYNLEKCNRAIFLAMKKMLERSDTRESGVENIRHFAKEIYKMSDISKEVEGYKDIRMAPLVFQIGEIVSRRNNFSNGMKLYDNIFGLSYYYEIEKQVEKIIKKWKIISNGIIRALVMGKRKIDVDFMKNELLEIAEQEENIAATLIKYTK